MLSSDEGLYEFISTFEGNKPLGYKLETICIKPDASLQLPSPLDLMLIDFRQQFELNIQHLNHLKSSDTLRCIPCVGLIEPSSTCQAYQLYEAHINAVVPLESGEHAPKALIEQILAYWLSLIVGPGNNWSL